jgi:hypothetical protein
MPWSASADALVTNVPSSATGAAKIRQAVISKPRFYKKFHAGKIPNTPKIPITLDLPM